MSLPKKYGPVQGIPVVITTAGQTTIYTPGAGKRIRLKWLAMATAETNTATVIATVKIGTTNVYIWPLGAPGAFMHSSIREGEIDEVLSVTVSQSQDVYVNFDVEEF